MPNIIRKLFSNLNGKLIRRFTPSRRTVELPVKITIEPDRHTGKLSMKTESLSLRGATKDLSLTGLAFCLDSIRLQEYYLVGEQRTLFAEIDLLGRKVKMQIIGQRYEQVGEHLSITKYLIGATIIKMSETDRIAYEDYVRFGEDVKSNKNLTLGLGSTKS